MMKIGLKSGRHSFTRDWHVFEHQDEKYDHGLRSTREMIIWCTEHFGQAPKWGSYPGAPDAWTRWWCTGHSFKFRDEADYTFFLLRWS